MLISLVISVFALLVIGGIIWMIIEGIVHISQKNKAIDNFLTKLIK
ncbi:membrane spanning protein [Staphylococcus aureus]|nr:membrane spanning protein [Staphylococcus aureus]CAC8136823.1 membrane spanning protein [Staphylococcus aureus]